MEAIGFPTFGFVLHTLTPNNQTYFFGAPYFMTSLYKSLNKRWFSRVQVGSTTKPSRYWHANALALSSREEALKVISKIDAVCDATGPGEAGLGFRAQGEKS